MTPFALDAPDEPVDAQVAGLDAVERRQRSAENVVQAAILAGALDRDDVDRLLDDADDGAVAPRVRADLAELLLGQVPALAAEAHARLDVLDRASELERVLGRVESMWNASRCAVRRPIPGSLVSCVTRFSTAGLSTPGA